MVRRYEKISPIEKEKLRGGNGVASLRTVFSPEQMRDKLNMFTLVSLPPGASVGQHEHSDDSEIYYIVKGRAEVSDNGSRQTLYPGDSLLTGKGESHSIINPGPETLEFLAVILPE
ncbi:MAG: cupin domain-containing protein [Spirochaetia bacterium]